jgi:ergothioneine biosynthesis protein EgtB
MQPSRPVLLNWYLRNRDRSHRLFGLIRDEAFYTQPIALRHPIVFYEGHLPGFSFNTLMKRALGAPSIDSYLETLFARGIDPDESAGAGVVEPRDHAARWPSRATVRAFTDEADRQIVEALQTADFDVPGGALDPWEAAFTMLEHEAMHQETLLYMWHRLPFSQKIPPAGYQPRIEGAPPRVEWIQVPAGCVTLGVDRSAIPFAWDNESPGLSAQVDTFAVERHNVTNERFLEFVEAGGYRQDRWWTPEDWQWVSAERVEHPLFWERQGDRWWWRGMFELIPLPLSWPVYVSMAEASAFARWHGARLPSEAEFQRAAYGSPEGERQYPWGSEEPSPHTGVFDFDGWDPQPAGSHAAGKSAWGIDDLVGNGWEWTSTPFAPFPGFRAMASYPEYSADFFDGQHFVMKGASVATARELIRPTFRNWFRPRYPYVYATFRCVRHTPSQR